MKIILASASPRRKDLLSELIEDFECKSSDIEEVFDDKLSVYENVMKVAYDKGDYIHKLNADSLVISADTIVTLDGEVFGKPKDPLDAYMMLKKLINKAHSVITGVCVIYKDQKISYYEESFVYMKDASDEQILDYVKTKEPLDKAGSYAIQGLGSSLIDKYEGDYNNIVGLPLKRLKTILNDIKATYF